MAKLTKDTVQKVIIQMDDSNERLTAELRYAEDDQGELNQPIFTILDGSLQGQTITPKTHVYRIVSILESPFPIVESL